MSDFLKLRVSVEAAEDSDYSVKYFDTSRWDPFVLTPDEIVYQKVEAALDASTTTVTTSIYTTITLCVVYNLDSTNYVTATFRSAGNSSTDNIVRIPAGGYFVTTDFTAASNLVLMANTAVVNCMVLLAGT